MNHDPLDPLVDDYARRPLPRCPNDMLTDIWREIENRRRRPFWSRLLPLLDWRELFREPRLAIAGLVCALAVGVLPAALAARAQAEQQLARRSFHFEVFATSAPKPLAPRVPNPGASTHRNHP